MLIAISGKMGAGKDIFADFLVKNHQFTRVAFADHLKDTAAFMTAIPRAIFDDPVKKNEVWYEETGVTPRQVLEWMGTELGRRIDPNLWVRRAMEKIGDHRAQRYVVTDMRFPNEYEAVREAGGFLVRVRRAWSDFAPTQSTHVSNTALDNYTFDQVVNNDYDLDMLRALASFTVAEAEKADFLR